MHTLDARCKNETPRTDDVCLLWAEPIFLSFILKAVKDVTAIL